MVSTLALYAAIGLVLLVPLEIVILIILYALSRKQDVIPSKIVVPKPEKRAKYEWETYLQLKKERVFPAVKAVLIILLVMVVVAVLLSPVYFLAGPIAQLFESGNETETLNEPETIELQLNDTNATNATGIDFGLHYSLNLTFAGLDINTSAMPGYNAVSPYKQYVLTAISSIIIIVIVLGAFIGVRRQRQMSVINKAKKTADKLIKKAEGKQPRKIPEFVAPLVIGAVAVIIAAVIWFRDSLATLPLIIWFSNVATGYRWYIIVALILIAITVAVLQRLSPKNK